MSDEFDAKEFVRSLTHLPGVYRMLNAKHDVIYVGKARDLKKRVSTYFQKRHDSSKTAAMVKQVAKVEVTVTNTEAEALLLEYNLIKQHRPRFNILLRDDKSYPYICATTSHDFPRLRFHRGARKGKDRFFGPYPSVAAVRQTLNELQKLFLIRQCRDSYFSNRSRPCLQYQIKRCSAPCVGLVSKEDYAEDVSAAIQFLEGRNQSVIDLFVKRMEDASEKLEFEQAARFRDQIKRLKEVEKQQLMSKERGMDIDVIGFASNNAIHCVTVLFIRNGAVLGSRDFFPKVPGETEPSVLLNTFAAQYYLGGDAPKEIVLPCEIEDADVLSAQLSEQRGTRIEIRHRVRGDRKRWLELAGSNAEQGLNLKVASNATIRKQFEALGEAFGLDETPERLECFDVSHTSGEATVASCVVFNGAGPLKSDYRRFNLSPESRGDDYAPMAEALRRRYERIKKGEVPVPDLLFIDGGKGQLAEAVQVLRDLDLEWVNVVGVAKGRARRPGAERIFLPGESKPTQCAAADPADPRRSPSLRDHRSPPATGESQDNITAGGDSGTRTKAAP